MAEDRPGPQPGSEGARHIAEAHRGWLCRQSRACPRGGPQGRRDRQTALRPLVLSGDRPQGRRDGQEVAWNRLLRGDRTQRRRDARRSRRRSPRPASPGRAAAAAQARTPPEEPGSAQVDGTRRDDHLAAETLRGGFSTLSAFRSVLKGRAKSGTKLANCLPRKYTKSDIVKNCTK